MMRIGLFGVCAAYWPRALGEAVRKSGAELVAAAHLGDEPELVERLIKGSPEEFAEQMGLALYEDPVEMIREGGPGRGLHQRPAHEPRRVKELSVEAYDQSVG